MKKNTFVTRMGPFIAVCLASPMVAFGQTVLFEDDFNSAFAGEAPTIPPWTAVTDNTDFGDFTLVRQDLADLFGKGTENQYLEFFGTSGVTILEAVPLPEALEHEVVTLSFDFYEPDGAKQDPLIIFVYGGIDGTDRVERLRLTHGGIGATAPSPENRVYTLDTVNRLDLIVNNSAQSIAYLSGTQTLAAGRSAIWINGNLINGDYSFEPSASGPIRGLDFRTFSSIPNQEMFIDDVTLVAGAQVRFPEAATTPLMEFLFEGNLVNTGSLGGEGTFVHQRENDPNHNWVWANRASLGEGLSGQSESGLDNTQVGGMGDYGQGTVREGGFFFPGTGLRDLQSVTITSWFKTPADTVWSSAAYMASWLNAIDYRHQDAPGQRVFLSVPLGQSSPITRREFSGPTAAGQTPWQQFSERWTFQAVTFNGTTGTMSFYYAYEDSDGVTVDATRTGMAVGPLRNLTIDIAFGNIYSGVRPFKGRLDNVRVFGSEDGTGALSLAAISQIWAADLAAAQGSSEVADVRIVDFGHDGTSFNVSFETDPNTSYTVERSSDLVDWEPIHTVVGDGSIQSYSDPVAAVERRFYRVRAELIN